MDSHKTLYVQRSEMMFIVLCEKSVSSSTSGTELCDSSN